MLGQLDGLSIELSRNKGRKSVKNFSDFPDVVGPPRIWAFGILLVRVAVENVDGPLRAAIQCYYGGAAVGRIIPEDCIRSEYHCASAGRIVPKLGRAVEIK